jgi:16S rRNA (guanine966-N2)-methyltransferase
VASLRVIAGTHRGRPLRAPQGLETRPTSGRVREALFNILGDVAELEVLDLYAGSGALGIEALSRGARRAVFVESRRPALTCLRRNLSDLGLDDRSLVLPIRVEQARAQLTGQGRFDLVLCDPPWAKLANAIEELDGWVLGECLAPGGRLVLEHPERETPGNIAGVSATDRRTWGDTGISIYFR